MLIFPNFALKAVPGAIGIVPRSLQYHKAKSGSQINENRFLLYGTQEETRTPTPYGIRTSSVLVYHSNTWACYTFPTTVGTNAKAAAKMQFFL